MRFYRPYEEVDQYQKEGFDEKSGFLKVEIRIPPSKEEYEAMSPEEKKQLYIGILRDQVVVSARRANVANREKDSELRGGGKIAFARKDEAIVDFLVRAHKYNELVPVEEQIAFGFQTTDVEEVCDKKTGRFLYDDPHIALNASIPGFTRLSVHLGRQTINIFNQANEKLGKIIYPINGKDQNRYNETKAKAEKTGRPFIPPVASKTEFEIASRMPYKFESSHVISNLGLMVSDNYNNSEEYAKQLKLKAMHNGKISKDGIDEFICFMHPDLNEREIMYLAEKAGFGKSVLKTILGRTKERGKYIENPDEVRKKFISEKLAEAKTDEERKTIIKELGESYFMAAELQQEDISEVQMLKDFCKIIPLGSIDREVAHSAIASIIDGMLERADGDTQKISEILPLVTSKNRTILCEILKNYENNDIAELIVDEDAQFVQKSYEVLIKYANEEQKKRILSIAKTAKEDFGFDDDVLGIYEEMKEIAESSMPEERKEAEEIEQLLLELNRDRGEDE